MGMEGFYSILSKETITGNKIPDKPLTIGNQKKEKKYMKKRLLAAIISLAMIFSLLPSTALAAEPDSGSCGSGVTWSYDGAGKLTISGHGEINDYHIEWGSNTPWGNYWQEITQVVIESGVTRVGNGAFGGAMAANTYPNLSSVSLPDTLISIGEYAFAGAAISTINLPSALETIDNYAFAYTDLNEITIPENVDYLAETAFSECGALTAINVEPNNLNYFSDDGALYQKLFGDQYHLLSYPAQKNDNTYSVLNGTVEIVESCFASNHYLQSIVLPNSLTELPPMAFLDCTNLNSVTLPESLYSVSSTAFCGCTSLLEIHIPASVSSFTSEYTPGEWLFDYSPLSVYFYGNAAPAFDAGIAELRDSECQVTIYYPEDATGWDAVQQQDDLSWAIEYGALRFETWKPESSGDPETPPTSDKATILRVYPVGGANDVGYDASNPPHFEIQFDRDISAVTAKNGSTFADLDFSEGSMKIFRASDNMLIYEVTYDDYMNDMYEIEGTVSGDTTVRNGNTLVLEPFNAHTLLDPGTEYYITVDEGFIRFEDGTVTPQIKSHEWQFSTGATTFTFLGFDGKTEREYEYHFSESFFTSPSTFYDHELAKMSLNLALSAFNSSTAAASGYARQEAAKNVVDLMQNIGFKEIDVSSYEGKPTRYSIAEAIGQKQIKDHSQEYTLIAVAIRGGGYEREWASNVSVFSDIEHQGFSLAANDVMNDLLQYINQYVDDTAHIKLWITGYSRGAAVANLMSAKLSQQLKNGNLGN